MNYKKLYNALIESRLKNPPKENFEKHHILPKSLFHEKAKDKNNLVKLTYREHYVAHHLLYLHYKKKGDKNATMKMALAWRMMCKNTNGLHVSINEYEKAKQADKEERKIKYKGKGNPFYGKHLSDDHKKKMALKLKGRKTWNKGKHLSKEHIEKLKYSHFGKSSPNKGKIWINNGIISKFSKIDQIPNGFVKGKLKKNK